MPGYEGDANTILDELNFLPYDTPFTPTEQPHSTTKYEFWDLGGGEHMLNLANPGLSTNILIKFTP